MSLPRLAVQAKTKIGILVSAAVLCAVSSANAEYRINIGDTLEISVAGVPELRQRVVVQFDGSISYPLLGNSFVVAGLSPSEIRARIGAILPTKVFRQRTPDGRENVLVIEPDQVTANVVEYRPIYVNGDVSKPSEQSYRPLMTVRQAVALAGGYEIMRFRMNNPFLDAADLRSEYEALWTDFAKEQAHLWRLKTELGEDVKLDESLLHDTPLPSAAISQITNSETEQMKGHQDDYRHEREFLQRGISQTEEEIGVLSDQLQKENAGYQDDIEDLQRLTGLYKKSEVTVVRVTEARRALLLSSTRKLQTTAQLLRARRQRDDFARQLERLDDQRRVNLQLELEGSVIRLNQTRAKLQAVGEKIEYTGVIRSQLVRGTGGKPKITIVRKGEKGPEPFAADEETELQPGDVVEVALQPPMSPQSDRQAR
jgi:polysaccharide biosynthesis/export protein